jgi:predicted RNase H-like nuclease (RuvC/YqgF family)
MADTFKKVESEAPASSAEDAPEDAWKDVQVEKEHQPEKVKSNLTYRNLEKQVEKINLTITSLTGQKATLEAEKTTLEAEMAQVKATAEAE